MRYTLITGASSGIGYELASVFARNHHNLILVARSEDILSGLKKELEKTFNVQVEVISADLSLVGAAQNLFNAVQAKKLTVDCLVNNAGFGDHGVFLAAKLTKITEMIHLNITTLTELTHLFLPQMVQNKFGQILNVASTAAFQPGPLMTVYYATKAYVLFFSEGLYEELKGTGVTVTALCPGPTESGFQAAAGIKNIALFDTLKIPSSKAVAEYGYIAMNRGQAVAVHGVMNRLMSSTVGLLPRSLARQFVMKLQESKVKN
jgi:short-subunit dehydrogenase